MCNWMQFFYNKLARFVAKQIFIYETRPSITGQLFNQTLQFIWMNIQFKNNLNK